LHCHGRSEPAQEARAVQKEYAMSVNVGGPLFIVAFIVIVLAIGIGTGRFLYGCGFNLKPYYVERSENPVFFWLIVAVWIAMVIVLLRQIER